MNRDNIQCMVRYPWNGLAHVRYHPSHWSPHHHPFQGYGPAVKVEEEDRHMNVNVSSSGQGTKTVILQIPKVRQNRRFYQHLSHLSFFRTSSKMEGRAQKLYENVLDLVLGTLYITSYFNHQHQLLEFQGAPLQTLVAPSRQFSCQHWLSSPSTLLALRKL